MVLSTLYPWFLIAIGSYLLGSIPAGFLAGKICGVDLRTQGSGNIGATNAVRVLGKKWGSVVFLFDFLKGLVPVLLALQWGCVTGFDPASAPGALAALCSLLGHSFPIWLGCCFSPRRAMSRSPRSAVPWPCPPWLRRYS
jgi:glycerol-3-phosphate acyltransferase PlsY